MIYLANAFSLNMVSQYQRCTLNIIQISVDEVKQLIRIHKGFTSAVGHEATAKVLTKLLGIEVIVNRAEIKLNPGDMLIVFQLLTRLPEGAVLDENQLKALQYKFYVVQIQSVIRIPS